MRKLILLSVLFFPRFAFGQTSFQPDTVRIAEVVIVESTKPGVLGGFSDQTLDSNVLRNYQLYNISTVLSENALINIKSYGPGAISTISFRGTGAGHTQILWNDISINSPMLGQTDLSLIPSGFTDEIRILNGSASMATGNGGIGGSVNLTTKPRWDNGSSLLVNGGAGSFGTYSSLVRFRTGSDKFQSVTRGFYSSAENNFRYLNDASFAIPVYERRSNASFSSYNLMQEFYIRGDRSVTSINAWYTLTDRRLPSNMLVVQTPGAEKQRDESFRAMLNHDRTIGSLSSSTSLALFSSRLVYTNIPASINSDNRSNTLSFRTSLEGKAGPFSQLKVSLGNESDFVNTVNYSDRKYRSISSLSVSCRSEIARRLGLSVLIREIADNTKLLIPDFSAGTDLLLNRNRMAFLRLNISRNSKLASMNDLYWNPGGNSSLRNEYSYTGEATTDMKIKMSDKLSFSPSLGLFISEIKDMIQWLPSQYSYWTPRNFSGVRTSGVEASLSADLKIRANRAFKIRINYALNSTSSTGSGNGIKGKQLIYVPLHQVNASFVAELGSLNLAMNNTFIGPRFTDTDNLTSLPGYFLTGLTAGYNIKSGSSLFTFNIRTENIFNSRYEVIAYYPMPGRSVMFSIIYQFNRLL